VILVWSLLVVVSITRIISYSPIGSDVEFSFVLWINLIRWGLIISLVFPIYWAAKSLSTYRFNLLYHFVLSLVFASFGTIIFTFPGQFFFNGFSLELSRFVESANFYFPGLLVVVPILYAITLGYYHYKSNYDEYLREKVAQEKMEQDIIEAKLAVFRSQLDPHFLFNTLQGINTLIDINQVKAKITLQHLSNILQFMKIRKDEMKIELQEELAFVDYYLKIERIRYPDTLFVEKVIDNESLRYLLPTYTIQLLVENAVKHSISKSSSPEIIRIITSVNQNSLLVVVENSDQSFELEDLNNSNGIGLYNIKSRIDSMYERSKFKITKSDLGGLKVKLEIPKEIKLKMEYHSYENY